MTLTCNKKAYSDLNEECENCSQKEECINNGKYVFVEFAEMRTSGEASKELSNPILQDNSTVTIHGDSGFSFDVYKRDIEKSFKEQFNIFKFGA